MTIEKINTAEILEARRQLAENGYAFASVTYTTVLHPVAAHDLTRRHVRLHEPLWARVKRMAHRRPAPFLCIPFEQFDEYAVCQLEKVA